LSIKFSETFHFFTHRVCNTNLINFVAGDINEQDEDKQDQDQRADHDLNDIFVERQTECSVAVITVVAGSCYSSDDED